MGVRLFTLCKIAARGEKERAAVRATFTDAEVKAAKAIREHFAATGNNPSARELSRALGYSTMNDIWRKLLLEK